MKKTARILVIAVLASLLNTVVAVVPVQAEPGKLTEDFTTASLFNANNWVSTSSGAFGAHPCLTALNDSNPAISLSQGTTLPGCSNSPDVSGSGSLFLTSNDNQQAGTMLYNRALPTNGGLEISFYQAQYGGTGADGISFFVKDGSKTDLTVGQPGGNLGYKGIPGALFGVGFDSYGNWMNQGYGDGACTNNILGGVPKALAVRGPDTSDGKDGTSGFCILPGGFVAPNGAIGADYFGTGSDTRASAARPVKILVDPSTNNNPKIRVYMWKSGSLTQDVATAPIALTVDQPEQYKLAQTFKFGFSSSTGGAKDIHAIWGLEISPLVSASAPTVYVVPNNVTVQAGQAAAYTYKFYSDAAKTVEIAANTLSYPADMCSSSYTLNTNYPASLPITCTGAVAMYNTITTDTATLTVVRGTPSIAPATRTITGNGGTAITTTAAYTARNFLYPQNLGYTISPALPTGLVFTPATGVISGTTTVVGTTTHTVTATAVSETATATVTITIGAPLTYAYSVTYDKGTGTAGTLAAQTGNGTTVTLSAFSTSTMIKPGYTFSGWLGSNSTNYTDAQILTFTSALTVTLTAQWTANPSRTVTYNAGTGTGTVPSSAIVLQGATFAVAAGTGLTNPGYTFNGWRDETRTAYVARSTYTVAGSNVVLTAQWIANSARTVTYNAGTGTGTVPTQADVLQGATFIVAVGTTLTKPGYTFNGWKDETATAYLAGATFTVAATNVILTAQWTANPLRTITYNAGTGTGTVPTQVDVLQGATFIVAVGTGLTKPGYTFNGWKDATDTAYAAAATYTAGAGNVVLTAQWSATSQSVTYIANGATGTVPTQVNVLTAGTFTVAAASTLTKTGSTFTGWKDANGIDYSAGSVFTMGITNVTLTAQWQINTYVYAIAYEANGGIGTMPGQTGSGTTVKTFINTFTKAGYKFVGWKDDAGVAYKDGQEIQLIASTSLVLRAQWEEITFPYAITFDANGGAGTMPGQTGNGSSLKLAANTFTRTAFTFAGWKDDAGNIYADQQALVLTASTSLVLRAQWVPGTVAVYPFAITFDANGGAGVMPGQVGIASTVILLVNKFTRAGYLFNGWKDDAGVSYVDAESITLKATTSLILRAQWIKNDLGIDNITCLGNFAKSCALKPGAAQPVSFKTNSNQLTAKSIAILKKWKLQNAKSVVIYGYASKAGSKALNDKLTAKRAAEVGAWVKKNWPNLTIKTKGLGTRVNSLCKAFDNKCAMITIVSLNKK